jgi:ferrochelatase
VSERTPIGVVVMAYGTPSGPEDVEAFYTDVRRGRPPTPELLGDLQRRYEAIGGVSPLAARTRAQVAGLQRSLDEAEPGGYRCAQGAKHSAPRIEDALDELASSGVGRAIGLVLAPHYSALSIGEYGERLREHATLLGLKTTMIESWHDLPELIELLAERVTMALGRVAATRHEGSVEVPGAPPGGVEVLFTAHSLPARIVQMGDPYPDQLHETAAAVAALAGVTQWRTAWQSAGRTPEPWLGPDLLEVLRSSVSEGVTSVVVCPAGFTSDHLEVLYDVDVEAQRVAGEAGLKLVRTDSLNDDPRLCAALAGLVIEAADRL